MSNPRRHLLIVMNFLLIASSVRADYLCGENKYIDPSACLSCCDSANLPCSTYKEYSVCCVSSDCSARHNEGNCSTSACKNAMLDFCCTPCPPGSNSAATSLGCSGPAPLPVVDEHKSPTPWFMKSGLSSVAFIVTLSLHCFIVVVTIVLQMFTVDQRDTRFLGKLVLPLLWFVYDIFYMSARLNWFLTSSDAGHMETYTADKRASMRTTLPSSAWVLES